MLRFSSLATSFLLLTTVFLGAGCTIFPVLTTPHIADPIQPAGGTKPVMQLQGFGRIPQPPAPPLRPGIIGSIQVAAPFPDIPPNVTVLRLPSGYPNVDELRSLTTALDLPGASLGAQPVTSHFQLEWKDERGMKWTYHPNERRLEFTIQTSTSSRASTENQATIKQLLEKVATFMDDYGIKRKRYTEPYIQPDPASSERTFIIFDATQDGQAIFNGDGSPVQGARFNVNKNSGVILSGNILLSTDPQRSDYPGISREEAREQMARGGQGGTPRGDVTVNDIKFEWVYLNDDQMPPTTYLYPALVGYGAIRYPEGNGSSYRIVVPLVK